MPRPTRQRDGDAAPPRNATETRERILDAARSSFSRRSYENVGVREIANGAGVDAALVNRYFGNKEALFAEVVRGAFHIEEHLPQSLDTLGVYLVQTVAGEDETDISGFNPLRLLILAASSPDTASMVSDQFHAEFVRPLAVRLGGRDSELRAALIASYVIGLATMRHLLGSEPLAKASPKKLAALAGEAIQRCVAHEC